MTLRGRGQIYKPNGMCVMIPHITKSLDEVATELNGWMYGEKDNNMLEKWYKKYGEYFIE